MFPNLKGGILALVASGVFHLVPDKSIDVYS